MMWFEHFRAFWLVCAVISSSVLSPLCRLWFSRWRYRCPDPGLEDQVLVWQGPRSERRRLPVVQPGSLPSSPGKLPRHALPPDAGHSEVTGLHVPLQKCWADERYGDNNKSNKNKLSTRVELTPNLLWWNRFITLLDSVLPHLVPAWDFSLDTFNQIKVRKNPYAVIYYLLVVFKSACCHFAVQLNISITVV